MSDSPVVSVPDAPPAAKTVPATVLTATGYSVQAIRESPAIKQHMAFVKDHVAPFDDVSKAKGHVLTSMAGMPKFVCQFTGLLGDYSYLAVHKKKKCGGFINDKLALELGAMVFGVPQADISLEEAHAPKHAKSKKATPDAPAGAKAGSAQHCLFDLLKTNVEMVAMQDPATAPLKCFKDATAFHVALVSPKMMVWSVSPIDLDRVRSLISDDPAETAKNAAKYSRMKRCVVMCPRSECAKYKRLKIAYKEVAERKVDYKADKVQKIKATIQKEKKMEKELKKHGLKPLRNVSRAHLERKTPARLIHAMNGTADMAGVITRKQQAPVSKKARAGHKGAGKTTVAEPKAKKRAVDGPVADGVKKKRRMTRRALTGSGHDEVMAEGRLPVMGCDSL